MRKYLPLAALLLAGCSERDVVHADSLERIHVDAVSQTLNLTVVSDDGRQTTIVFSPDAAVQAQGAMARMMLLTLQDAEAPRAQPAIADPSRDPRPLGQR